MSTPTPALLTGIKKPARTVTINARLLDRILNYWSDALDELDAVSAELATTREALATVQAIITAMPNEGNSND